MRTEQEIKKEITFLKRQLNKLNKEQYKIKDAIYDNSILYVAEKLNEELKQSEEDEKLLKRKINILCWVLGKRGEWIIREPEVR